MSTHLLNYRHQFFLVLIILVAELVVWPVGEFPLNDDWTYVWSARHLYFKGDILLNNWPAMTLWSHLVWALPFMKLFGISFFVLRFSVLVAAAIALLLLFTVVRKRAGELAAWTSSLGLFFYPVFFNLSNSFMTDITFMMFVMVCIFLADGFFKSGKAIYLLAFSAATVLLILNRQLGLAVAIALLGTTVFHRRYRKPAWVIAALLIVVTDMVVLRYYENYLRPTLSPDASYKFSDTIHPFSPSFWISIGQHLSERYSWMSKYILAFSSPVACLVLPGYFKRKPLTGVLVLLLSFAFVYLFLSKDDFPYGNVLQNMNLGVDTFYQSLVPASTAGPGHNYKPWFGEAGNWITFFAASVSLATIALRMMYHTAGSETQRVSDTLLVLTIFVYLFFVLIFDFCYDRYTILPVTLLSILMAEKPGSRAGVIPAYSVIALMAVVSVLGTRDYFELNRVRWQAYYETIRTTKVSYRQVTGGFETDCWNMGLNDTYWPYMYLERYQYLIQYDAEKDFVRYKAYPFTRYFPPRADTLFVFKRTAAQEPR